MDSARREQRLPYQEDHTLSECARCVREEAEENWANQVWENGSRLK